MNKFFGSILIVVIIFGCPTFFLVRPEVVAEVGKIVQTKACPELGRRVWHPTERGLSPFQITSITPKTPQDFILLGQKININSASKEALETLPGIGPSLAERIIKFRERNGIFRSIDELDKVEGIGPKKLEILAKMTSF